MGRINAHLPEGVQIFPGRGCIGAFKGADQSLFIFSHCCRFLFGFTHQIKTCARGLDIQSYSYPFRRDFLLIKSITIIAYSTHAMFEFFLGGGGAGKL